ncbi:MAG: hydantoinase/oxoprolinase family protein [Clostridiales Family XIII bacterium]|jgi:N-methylhydantoinase A|nr:hydantoinase/oxoprolinase family protein [Clostridiales Family XIII bacterium]
MRIATDIGGTFTDLVALDEQGDVCVVKGDTTPPDFERGVVLALEESGINPSEVSDFIHGATTIINALTERKGAKTGLITTKGFRDVLEIARCNRPDLFNLVFAKPRPFIPRSLRFEVEERIAYDGGIITPLNRADIEKAVAALKKEGVEAVAICYINSYANDAHERETAAYIRELWSDVFVTSSVEVTREWREYERTSTIALNAYVGPVASRYINNLEKKLEDAGVKAGKYFMQSNGGATSFNWAKTAPISMVESGPVAGVFGAAVLGQILGEKQIIALDVGGTTAKCSLIDGGEVKITTNYRIERDDRNAGYPIMVPVVDIVEIGNGGGSVAWIDEAGSLRVGPRSAGALPGPVAYGRGGVEPTTTDACLVAGRLSAENFDSAVDMDAVKEALSSRVGEALGVDAERAATSVIRVAESNMYNALKLISVRRGYDPRDFTLVAFGGGGPMHASALADELGIDRVIIPVAAAVFSAWGMLMTDMRHDYIQTTINMLDETSAEEWDEMWGVLLDEAKSEFTAHGVRDAALAYSYYADMRYAGQEHTVKVQTPAPSWDDAVKAEILERFHVAHEHNYTYRLEGARVELVNLHLVVRGHMDKPELSKLAPGKIETAEVVKERRRVYFTGSGWLDAEVYDRAALPAGTRIKGPAIIEEKAASALVGEGRTLTVDDYGNLIIEKDSGLRADSGVRDSAAAEKDSEGRNEK